MKSEDCYRASAGLKTKEKQELSTSPGVFISCRVKLRVKLAGAARYGSMVRESRDGERKGKVVGIFNHYLSSNIRECK